MLNVFVYGTLKPGEAYYAAYCQPYVLSAVPAIAQGRLFHLPQGYPAMTVDPAPSAEDSVRWVTGSLLSFQDERAIADLDEFEDYDPRLSDSQNLYVRQQRPVFSPARQPLGTAWIYTMSIERINRLGGVEVVAGEWSRASWPSIFHAEA